MKLLLSSKARQSPESPIGIGGKAIKNLSVEFYSKISTLKLKSRAL